MKADLSGAEKRPMTFDPDDEAGRYLEALADTRVFSGKQADTSSLEGIFTTALGAEKDSILFYLGMKDLVPAASGKDRIEEIIREEMRHVEILGKRLLEL
jgi:rubrerythrin